MPTVSIRLDDDLVQMAVIVGKAHGRSLADQIEHWGKIGQMMESNPDLPYAFVKQALIAQAEKELQLLTPYKFG